MKQTLILVTEWGYVLNKFLILAFCIVHSGSLGELIGEVFVNREKIRLNSIGLGVMTGGERL